MTVHDRIRLTACYRESPGDGALFISGSACPVPFWGCLECQNAVITVRKLPALLAFERFMVDQRAALSEADWKNKFGQPYRRIVEQILPQFSSAEVNAARDIANAVAGLVYLPPEAGIA